MSKNIIDCCNDVNDISYEESLALMTKLFYNIWFAAGIDYKECHKILDVLAGELNHWEGEWRAANRAPKKNVSCTLDINNIVYEVI